MKKRLFSILTILGIGCSFCSADGVYHNSDLGLISVVIDGETKYTLKDKNEGATCTDTSQSCSYGNYYQRGNNYGFSSNPSDSYTTASSSLDWSLYGPGNYFNSNGIYYITTYYQVYNTNMWGGITNTNDSRQGPCPSGFSILGLWTGFYSDVSSSLGISTSAGFKQYFFMPFAGYRSSSSSNISSQNKYGYYWSTQHEGSNSYRAVAFFMYSNGVIQKDYNVCSYGYSVRCFKNEVVEPTKDSWVVLAGDELPELSPKFKVNYGNTSYEYELDSDLSIYLKSPVIQSGNTFSYAGSTGLNLFYNNTSQRYNKSNLYLDSMFWYNKNIFTPICL